MRETNSGWTTWTAGVAVAALFFGLVASAMGQQANAIVPVSEDEAKQLQFMREEEKLARDIYLQLNEKWNLVVFRNIAASEEQHMGAVGRLLERYAVEDPAANKPAGVYTDERLTALYAELMEKGTRSVKEALEVGVLIEKTDIADLETSIKMTVKWDIKRVYTNLMNASYNHLEAFETNLELMNGTN